MIVLGCKLLFLIGNENPGGHGNEAQAQNPLKRLWTQKTGNEMAQIGGKPMVCKGCNQDTQDNWQGATVTGGQNKRQQLGLVAYLGKGHKPGRQQKGLHFSLP